MKKAGDQRDEIEKDEEDGDEKVGVKVEQDRKV